MVVERNNVDLSDAVFATDWQTLPLSAVAEVIFSNVDKITRLGETPVRLCNYTDVYDNDYIVADMEFMRATATRTEIDRFGLQPGDVMITKDSETPDDIGISAVVDTSAPDILCGYHLALIRPKRDLVDPTFLSKQLKHNRIARYYGQQANGSTRYGLSTSSIANTPLKLPDLDTQRASSALMRLIDDAIAKTEAVIAKLKHIRSGLLHDLLTCGLDENGQLRDSVAHPEQFEDLPLGRIPKAWRIAQLGEVLSMQAGNSLNSESISMNGKYPVYGGNGVRGYTSTFTHEGMFVLIGRQGALCGNIIVAFERFYATEHAVVVTPKEQMNVGWLACYLEDMNLNRFSESSAQPGLSVNKISYHLMRLPTFSEQEAIGSLLKSYQQRLASEHTVLQKYYSIKSGLMSDMLTGTVKVPKDINVQESKSE